MKEILNEWKKFILKEQEQQLPIAMTITSKNFQQIPQVFITTANPQVTLRKGKGSFVYGNKQYIIDFSDIMPNFPPGGLEQTRLLVAVKAEDAIPDFQGRGWAGAGAEIKPGSVLVGFSTSDGRVINIAYLDINGIVRVKGIGSY